MTPEEIVRIATALREASAPIGRYQPIRVAGACFPGWTGSRGDVRAGTYKPLGFAAWTEMLALDRLPLAGATVLDAGCNTGSLAFEAARAGAVRVRGLDIDLRCLEYGALWYCLASMDPVWPLRGQVSLEWADLTAAREPADVVFALSVLHHVPRQGEALRALAALARRVLVLEMQTPAPDVEGVAMDEWVDVSSPLAGDTYGHGHFPTPGCLERTLAGLGFARVEWVGPGRVPGRHVLHAHR